MTTDMTIRSGQRSSYWAWPGPADLYVVLLLGIAAFLVAHFLGKSEFAMALMTALIICFCPAYQTLRRGPAKWTPYAAWVVRVGAAAAGYWLFIATPTPVGRFIASAIYATAYVLCDWAAWHRVQVDRNVVS